LEYKRKIANEARFGTAFVDEHQRVTPELYGRPMKVRDSCLRLVTRVFVAGIDISADMVRLFQSRKRGPITDGLIEVKVANSERIPHPDAHFDQGYKVVHTLFFLASGWQQKIREEQTGVALLSAPRQP
jgi:hypothetical protein